MRKKERPTARIQKWVLFRLYRLEPRSAQVCPYPCSYSSRICRGELRPTPRHQCNSTLERVGTDGARLLSLGGTVELG